MKLCRLLLLGVCGTALVPQIESMDKFKKTVKKVVVARTVTAADTKKMHSAYEYGVNHDFDMSKFSANHKINQEQISYLAGYLQVGKRKTFGSADRIGVTLGDLKLIPGLLNEEAQGADKNKTFHFGADANAVEVTLKDLKEALKVYIEYVDENKYSDKSLQTVNKAILYDASTIGTEKDLEKHYPKVVFDLSEFKSNNTADEAAAGQVVGTIPPVAPSAGEVEAGLKALKEKLDKVSKNIKGSPSSRGLKKKLDALKQK